MLQLDTGMEEGAQLFAYLKQLLKMLTRQRDKAMMLSIIEEVSFIVIPFLRRVLTV